MIKLYCLNLKMDVVFKVITHLEIHTKVGKLKSECLSMVPRRGTVGLQMNFFPFSIFFFFVSTPLNFGHKDNLCGQGGWFGGDCTIDRGSCTDNMLFFQLWEVLILFFFRMLAFDQIGLDPVPLHPCWLYEFGKLLTYFLF